MIEMWAPGDIKFRDIDYDATEDPVLTISIETPLGVLEVMFSPIEHNRSLRLQGLHVQSAIDPNAIGPANWRLIAQVAMEYMDYDEIIVEGSVRTTGARPGHRPRAIRFTRRTRTAPGADPC